MKRINLTFLFLMSCKIFFAQSVLTLDEAIKQGLEKNYNVLIAKNQQSIAQTQNNIGNAGLSPTVSLNGAFNFSNLNSYQEFSNGTNQDRVGAISKNLGASLNASWMVFDGMRMFAVKKRLEANEQNAAIQLKQQMENLVYQIILAYNSIIKIKSQIKATQQNLLLLQERNQLAKVKFDIGSDSKIDYLLAQGNENRSRSDLAQLEIQLMTAKSNLSLLINNKSDFDYNTIDSIQFNFKIDYDDLKKSLVNTNKNILISKQNEIQLEQSIKEARAANIPQLQLNTAYNFTRNQSEAGFLFLNRQSGLNAGLTASWLIFNGNRNKKLVQERSILLQNQKYITEQNILEVDAWVFLQYQSFLLHQKVLAFESQNMQMAKEVMDISLQRYKLGKSNIIETIETQKNLEEAQSRYINTQYNLKVAETELLRANGSLVK